MDRLEVRGTDMTTDRPTPAALPVLSFRARDLMRTAAREKHPQLIG
jgi:hypothetical protein